MKPISIIGIILTVVTVALLKIFQDSIPTINERVTNIAVLVGIIICIVIFGISRIRKK